MCACVSLPRASRSSSPALTVEIVAAVSPALLHTCDFAPVTLFCSPGRFAHPIVISSVCPILTETPDPTVQRLRDMSGPQWRSQTVPAQLAFLAIYNPSLGPTDDTFRKQLLFYYARTTHEARASARKAQRSRDLSEDEARAEENEQLRQIGLAQGMVDFAR